MGAGMVKLPTGRPLDKSTPLDGTWMALRELPVLAV